jgi:hypothetical protein
MGKIHIEVMRCGMPEQTMTLRDAAQSLARAKNPKATGIQSSKLLSLLRSGELKAGFYFFRGTIWIEILLAHWQGIDSNKFRIGRKPDDPKSGTYQVKANEFAEQVARTLWNNEQTGPTREQVTAVISETAKRYEVAVKTEDFQQYLLQHVDVNKATSNVGAPRKEWREVCSYMAAYFAAHQRDRGAEHLKIKQAKEDIHKFAKEDGVKNLPAQDTIKEEISKALGLLDDQRFNLRKPTTADRK